MVVNALLLAVMVDAHVAEHAQAQLTQHAVVIGRQLIYGELGGQQHRELRNGALAEQRLDTVVVEGQVDERFEEEDEVGATGRLDVGLVAVLDELLDHFVRGASIPDGLAAVRVERELLKDVGGGSAHVLLLVLKQVDE